MRKMNAFFKSHSKKCFGSLLTILTLGAVATLLSSCATTSPTETSEAAPVFKFTVLRYTERVPVPGWTIDPLQSSNPEGAALNIISEMQRGQVDQWLASWDNSDRPHLTSVEQTALLAKWLPLKASHLEMLGRVVADSELIIEISATDAAQTVTKVQIPLKHSQDQWYMTRMDPNCEFLNWERAANKIVVQADPKAIRFYLNAMQNHQASK
jgi:hypothetical protein